MASGMLAPKRDDVSLDELKKLLQLEREQRERLEKRVQLLNVDIDVLETRIQLEIDLRADYRARMKKVLDRLQTVGDTKNWAPGAAFEPVAFAGGSPPNTKFVVPAEYALLPPENVNQYGAFPPESPIAHDEYGEAPPPSNASPVPQEYAVLPAENPHVYSPLPAQTRTAAPAAQRIENQRVYSPLPSCSRTTPAQRAAASSSDRARQTPPPEYSDIPEARYVPLPHQVLADSAVPRFVESDDDDHSSSDDKQQQQQQRKHRNHHDDEHDDDDDDDTSTSPTHTDYLSCEAGVFGTTSSSERSSRRTSAADDAGELGPQHIANAPALARYFYNNCSRERAETILEQENSDSFVLRQSSVPNAYALSYVDDSRTICHCLMLRTARGWCLDGEKEFHSSATALLDAYGFL